MADYKTKVDRHLIEVGDFIDTVWQDNLDLNAEIRKLKDCISEVQSFLLIAENCYPNIPELQEAIDIINKKEAN